MEKRRKVLIFLIAAALIVGVLIFLNGRNASNASAKNTKDKTTTATQTTNTQESEPKDEIKVSTTPIDSTTQSTNYLDGITYKFDLTLTDICSQVSTDTLDQSISLINERSSFIGIGSQYLLNYLQAFKRDCSDSKIDDSELQELQSLSAQAEQAVSKETYSYDVNPQFQAELSAALNKYLNIQGDGSEICQVYSTTSISTITSELEGIETKYGMPHTVVNSNINKINQIKYSCSDGKISSSEYTTITQTH